MEQQPRRRFWQIHLSTALMLMFSASGLLWANARSLWPGQGLNSIVEWLPAEMRNDPSRWEYGWPFKAWYWSAIPTTRGDGFRQFFDATSAVYDIGVFVLLLCVLGFSLEFLIRRREVRKV